MDITSLFFVTPAWNGELYMGENLSDQKEFRRGTLMEDFDILAKRAKGSATRQKWL